MGGFKGMSHTHPKEAHHVKKGCYVMLKDRPCKIVEVKTSKTGKHGHAKCNITGLDILTGKKYNEVHPGHKGLRAFDQCKKEFDVIDINSETIFLLDPETSEQEELARTKGNDTELVQEMHKKFTALKDDAFLTVVITLAPYGPAGSEKLDAVVSEWKEGKD